MKKIAAAILVSMLLVGIGGAPVLADSQSSNSSSNSSVNNGVDTLGITQGSCNTSNNLSHNTSTDTGYDGIGGPPPPAEACTDVEDVVDD
jgi:hypothetical protein